MSIYIYINRTSKAMSRGPTGEEEEEEKEDAEQGPRESTTREKKTTFEPVRRASLAASHPPLAHQIVIGISLMTPIPMQFPLLRTRVPSL